MEDIENVENSYDYLIVGCGLSGVVFVERLASQQNKRVLIIEKRDHIGGNCYDYRDPETGILMNKYGAHLFHTNNERVWEYINRFEEWVRWEHKVLSRVDGRYVSMPVNITTINELCGTHLQTGEDVDKWLAENQVKYGEGRSEGEGGEGGGEGGGGGITNSEEMAKSRIGEVLYQKMVRHYTKKQWNKEPRELDPSVLARIPVRRDFDTRYFSDKYQALPKEGYTRFFEKLLDHPLITVKLNTDFFQYMKGTTGVGDCKIIFTGPIDAYFRAKGSDLPPLEYRSIDFKIERLFNYGFYQPCGAVNYPGPEVEYTRIIEYKHFLHQSSNHTVIVSETTNDHGEPYYPVPNKKNQELYREYQKLSDKEEGVYFIGRLINYKYFNMDQAISHSLEYYDKEFSNPSK